MKLSIRTRLTMIIALVFLGVFILLLVAGTSALYYGLTEAADRQLKIEQKGILELFHKEFQNLPTATGETSNQLTNRLLEELKEIIGYKQEFVLFSLEKGTSRHIFGEGGTKNIHFLLPRGFLRKADGFYNKNLRDRRYRVRISHQDWGTLVIGIKNETFFDLAQEFKEIIVIWIPLTFLMVLLGGYFLAGVVMNPVASAARAAENITLTNLKRRLPEYTGKDKFGQLISTLNAMIDRIEEGVKEIQQFTQNAAHELRTPLTILRGELELLYQQENLPDEARSSLQRALDRSIAMSKLVENLLLLSNADSHRYPVQKKIFPLHRLVKEVVEDVAILAEERDIRVETTDLEPVDFYGDEALIRQLLLNLSDNALKYTPRGKIEYSLRKTGDRLILVISDTGRGIPEEDQPHIFDRFYRARHSNSANPSGSGLGLAICQWVVQIHEGKMNIESEVNKGTVVTLEFPLKS